MRFTAMAGLLLDTAALAMPLISKPRAARTIAALLALRDHVIGPILAGVRSPRMGRKPNIWTPIDRRYESLRIGMQDVFHDLGITATAA
jgi:hypothetical protein